MYVLGQVLTLLAQSELSPDCELVLPLFGFQYPVFSLINEIKLSVRHSYFVVTLINKYKSNDKVAVID
jgi:hypothetical protein